MTPGDAPEHDRLDVPTHPPRFQQRIPTPPLSSGWRWGFPALLVAAIFGSLWLAAKAFRTFLLMYGKTPKLGEIVRQLRQA